MTSAVNRAVSTTFRTGAWHWRIAAPFATPEFSARLATPESLLQPPSTMVHRDPPRTLTIVSHLSVPGGGAWYIKRYNPGQIWRDLKDWFRASRAVRALTFAQTLLQLGIPTAAPVAAGERRRCGWLLDSYLITEEFPNACTWLEFESRHPDAATRRRIIRAVARVLARLHDAEITHHDPARPNFLVRQQAGGEIELILIDLDGLRRRWRMSDRVARKNLTRPLRIIPHGNLDRLRFVAEYCASRKNPGPLPAREWAQSLGLLPPPST